MDAGLKDLLVESGIYAEGTVDMMLMGKQFHRSVRGLALVFEEMMQQLLKEFFSWVDTKGSSPLLTPMWDQLKTTLGELETGREV